MTNSNFILAVHILSYLTYAQHLGKPVTSDEIAVHVRANPVMIRRLMPLLKKAQLLKAKKGPQGGFALHKPAQDISLRDVFEAVEGKKYDFFAVASMEKEGCSHVTERIQSALNTLVGGAEAALMDALGEVSLSHVLETAFPGPGGCDNKP